MKRRDFLGGGLGAVVAGASSGSALFGPAEAKGAAQAARAASGQITGDPRDVRQHIATVVLGTETTDPTVEQLHGLRPRGDLGVEVEHDRPRQPLHEFMPGGRLAIHECLGV